MRTLTSLFALLLCSAFLTTCTEEYTVISGPEPQPGPIAEAAAAVTVDGQTILPTHAYVQTSALPTGLYEHHLVVTTADVLRNGDLNGHVQGVVATVFRTETESPLGEHAASFTFNDDTPGLRFAGGRIGYDLTYELGLLEDVGDSRSRLTIREAEGGYLIAYDLFGRWNNRVTGTYAGSIISVELPNAPEAPGDEDFSGASRIALNDEVTEFTRAYFVAEDNSAMGGELYLAKRAVDQDGALVGTTDVFLVRVWGGRLATGRFQTNGSGQQNGDRGYFGRIQGAAQIQPFWCTGMNFATGSMTDDDAVDTGETLVRYENNHLELRTTGVTYGGKTVVAEYSGPVTVVFR